MTGARVSAPRAALSPFGRECLQNARKDRAAGLRASAREWIAYARREYIEPEPCECGAPGVHSYGIGGGWAYACTACRDACVAAVAAGNVDGFDRPDMAQECGCLSCVALVHGLCGGQS